MELDPVERYLAQSVIEMDEYDLFLYCQEWVKRLTDRPLHNGVRDSTHLRWLCRVYGPGAKLMLRRIFNERGGMIGDKPFSFPQLCRANRKILDDIYFALRDSQEEV